MKKCFSFRKIVSIIASITVLTVSLSGCSSSSKSSASKSKENISEPIQAYGEYDPQVSAQQIIADKMGYFKEEGLNVVSHLSNGPDQNESLIANGTAEVCFAASYDNISVAANNVKIKTLAPLDNASGTQCVVARKGSGIKSAKDLEGKKIGMTAGAGVLVAIRNMCKEMNVDISKINFVTLQVADQFSAFEKGDIDAVAVWEPWVGKAVAAGGTKLFSGSESYFPEKTGKVNWLDFYMTVAVTQKFYDKHPEQTVKLLKALSKATDFINKNPDKAAEIVSKEIKISKDECKRIMSENSYSMEFSDKFKNGANTMAAFMKDMKNIKEVPDFNSYNSSEPLSKVSSSLVTVSK